MPTKRKTALSDRELWDQKAEDWHRQVGDDGDLNRRLNSDPVLWRFLGSIGGLDVLDAGCGTGYLARQLARKGARVTGVDLSGEMIALARRLASAQGLGMTLMEDDCAGLSRIADASQDRVVSNYVLHDVADHRAALRSIARVLRPGGRAALVFLHPCFPLDDVGSDSGEVTYRWSWSYFDEAAVEDPPWNHFTSVFTSYHRPLSAYWRAIAESGLRVVDFDEPVAPPDADLPAERLRYLRMRPNSVAFLLEKA
ncbi:class I SAM-dependent methyltransferase [Pelagibius sp.]|uniref:class I SAM-dependent methyltransferase n=1 Tax=Pelagibius sp. TaxID=1931238 RepID=UPI00261C340D|nr:class I SAM-dependent methyltransferase [Pelagibius sp.]